MKPVRLARLARADVEEARGWYEDQVIGLGDRFLETPERTTARIGDSPRQFPVIHRGARRARLGRFPYGVFFVELDDYVRVVAVVHLVRHPSTWLRRIP